MWFGRSVYGRCPWLGIITHHRQSPTSSRLRTPAVARSASRSTTTRTAKATASRGRPTASSAPIAASQISASTTERTQHGETGPARDDGAPDDDHHKRRGDPRHDPDGGRRIEPEAPAADRGDRGQFEQEAQPERQITDEGHRCPCAESRWDRLRPGRERTRPEPAPGSPGPSRRRDRPRPSPRHR